MAEEKQKVAYLDINQLSTEPDDVEVDFDNYAEATGFVPIKGGTYTLKMLEAKFQQDDLNGFAKPPHWLTVILKEDVLDDQGKSVGQLRMDRVRTKPYEREGVKVSDYFDLLRALADPSRPATNQEKAQVVLAHVGSQATYRAVLRNEVYCGHKGTQHESHYEGSGKNRKLLSGSEAFELRGGDIAKKLGDDAAEGKCPTCGQTFYVNTRVSRRISAMGKTGS